MTPKSHNIKAVDSKRPFSYVLSAFKALPTMANSRKYVQTKGPTKTFQKDGHWIEKPNTTPVLICKCSNRYLKTRPGQTMCLRCASQAPR